MGIILLVTREVMGFETVLKYFEANTPNYVDCGTDVDKFINICLQFK